MSADQTKSRTCLALRILITFILISQTISLSNDHNIILDQTCKNDNIMPALSSKFRSVKRIMERPPAHWVGNGFHVYPVFDDMAFKEEISPLLMFDYAAPKRFPAKVGSPLGVGQHPHRGFETVTIAFQGEVEHHDSTGKSGIIKEGDVQWMTAGRGTFVLGFSIDFGIRF